MGSIIQLTAESNQTSCEPSASQRLLNRELSWLEFNSRVLSQAEDASLPLLERLKFISIYSSNLDEFFMKRVGRLKRYVTRGVVVASDDGLTPKAQLQAIRAMVVPQLERVEQVLAREIQPGLKRAGICLLRYQDLSEEERKTAEGFFRDHIFPSLTPFAVDAGHPFPFISNLSTSLGIALKHPDREERQFARLKLSSIRPQWIPLDAPASGEPKRFLSAHELVLSQIHEIFPGLEILGCMPFRVTRNADIEIDEEDADCLLELIEEEVRQRRVARVVRLEHGLDADPWILEFLREEFELHPDDIYEVPGELDKTTLAEIANLPIPELRFPSWSPSTPAMLPEDQSIFSVLRQRDVLVHHPYESFTLSVERFVRESADDPNVTSIKMTVYRIGDDSPLIPLLMRAAQSGKEVVCLVELKARFEEERNILWAQKLVDAGVHVLYGIPGLKTHAKTLLVVRKEGDKVRCYAHVATGNYHAKTANLYTDVGLFTARPEVTNDIVHFFNYLTGRSLKRDYTKLLVSPINMEQTFLSLIDDEIAAAREGKPAQIIGKMNSLEDPHVIEKLYEASSAGVQVDLIVRGLCCLRPGIAGLSEKIRVLSVIGRLLEHSRLYYFRHAAAEPVDGLFFLGSADWMSRNLHRRVEVIAAVEQRQDRERCWEIFQTVLNDKELVWEMDSNGHYRKRSPGEITGLSANQDLFMWRAQDAARAARTTGEGS